MEITPHHHCWRSRRRSYISNGVCKNSSPTCILALQVYELEDLRALYKGCGALVSGSIAKDAVRFDSFNSIKNVFRDPQSSVLSPAGNMLAGMAAGVAASIFAVTPTKRIKTALIDDARSTRQYSSTIHCIRTVIREGSLVGLYRGFIGTTLKQASATSFRMGSYNIIKDFQVVREIPQNTAVNFANGAAAGAITTLATQPFDTIKTRSESLLERDSHEIITDCV